MSQPQVTVVAVPSATPQEQNSAQPQNEDTNERALEMAQRFGELTARYETLQNEVIELRGQVEAGRADRSELEILRSELAGLRAEILALTQPQTPVGAVVEVQPDPEPIEDQDPPTQPKRSWIEIALSV